VTANVVAPERICCLHAHLRISISESDGHPADFGVPFNGCHALLRPSGDLGIMTARRGTEMVKGRLPNFDQLLLSTFTRLES
jgi:hypothetical protein